MEETIASNLGGAPTTLEALIAEKTWPTASGGYFCKFCLKVVSKGCVKSHFKDIHWGEASTYHCPVPECLKVYTAKSAFRSHLYRNHPNLKGVPIDQFKDDGLGQNLPESDPCTLSTEIVTKPETFAPDENMSEAANSIDSEATTSVDSEATTCVDQDSFTERNSHEAAEEHIASSSDAITSLQALIAENTRLTDDGKHFCIICDKNLAKGSIKSHFEDLHWSDAPTYFCPASQCQKVFTSKGTFRKHVSTKHSDWKGVPLETFLQGAEEPIAGSSGEALTSLEDLIAKKSRPTPDGYFCLICIKVLKKGSIKSHFEDLHWADAPSYLCPECQKEYTAKGTFRKHISTKHPDLKGVALETFRKVD